MGGVGDRIKTIKSKDNHKRFQVMRRFAKSEQHGMLASAHGDALKRIVDHDSL